MSTADAARANIPVLIVSTSVILKQEFNECDEASLVCSTRTNQELELSDM